MSAFYISAAALALLATAMLAKPLWTRAALFGDSAASDEVRTLSGQLRQLDELHRAGALTTEQHADSKTAVECKLIALLGDTPGVASPPRPAPRLVAALALFVVAVAGAGYAWLGSPQSLGLGPGSGVAILAGSEARGGADAAVEAPHALVPGQVAAMIEQLAKRLKDQPDDADGWLMMARSQVVLGKHAQAVEAFKQAARLHPDDAGLLADYADALAVAQGRGLDGEPATLIERALAVDASNPKALALAGTAAFDRHDYAGAIRHWEKLVALESGDDAFTQQIRAGIAEARELGGIAATSAPPMSTAREARPAASVSGTVTLAATLQGRAAPDDTLFVFARAADGSRMPLAILRKRVRDLPLQFILDDEMAMSNSAKLSGAQRVVVGARVSKSGDAMPQSGDLQGTLGAVVVGSAGLKVEIDRVVAK
ncbi:MAG: c-type cytochrome biogenesis protein CcmI [Caldimonas sp.]